MQPAEKPLEIPGLAPEAIIWEDEVWVLARHEATSGLGLTLHHRDPEAMGQLDDEHASQMGRIGNRLIRIIENLPDAGRVDLGRIPGERVQLTFEVAGVADDRLHEIAVKLSNWGGDARA